MSTDRSPAPIRKRGAAEGSRAGKTPRRALHLHPVFNEVDVYGDGKPTRIAHTNRDVRQPHGSLPISEKIGALTYYVPWFKRYHPDVIQQHADAYRKVAENYRELLDGDPGNPADLCGWPV